MSVDSSFARDIRTTICAIVAGTQTRRQVNDFVTICHGLASTVLRRKISFSMLESRFQYGSYRDMAYDCIADLFLQDEFGALARVKAYFEGVGIEKCDDGELLAHLRRLVVSRVNQEIFRIYSELDPSLGKVLRNIKKAIQALNSFSVESRFGEFHIIPNLTERNTHLPVIDAVMLERHLSARVNASGTIPEFLSSLALYLREQENYCRSVPLILVARAFRSIYIRDEPISESALPEEGFAISDTTSIIKETCLAMKQELGVKYMDKKNVPGELLDDYFRVIEKSLIHKFLSGDGGDQTFYETFKLIRPQLSRIEYYRSHRARIEYLARLTHKELIGKLKAEA